MENLFEIFILLFRAMYMCVSSEWREWIYRINESGVLDGTSNANSFVGIGALESKDTYLKLKLNTSESN